MAATHSLSSRRARPWMPASDTFSILPEWLLGVGHYSQGATSDLWCVWVGWLTVRTEATSQHVTGGCGEVILSLSRGFNSPTNYLRTSHVRVEPYEEAARAFNDGDKTNHTQDTQVYSHSGPIRRRIRSRDRPITIEHFAETALRTLYKYESNVKYMISESNVHGPHLGTLKGIRQNRVVAVYAVLTLQWGCILLPPICYYGPDGL
eukprot:7427958-Pyramimonas_sp.AAC.1